MPPSEIYVCELHKDFDKKSLKEIIKKKVNKIRREDQLKIKTKDISLKKFGVLHNYVEGYDDFDSFTVVILNIRKNLNIIAKDGATDEIRILEDIATSIKSHKRMNKSKK